MGQMFLEKRTDRLYHLRPRLEMIRAQKYLAFILPLFIEVSVLIQEKARSCKYVLGVSIFASFYDFFIGFRNSSSNMVFLFFILCNADCECIALKKNPNTHNQNQVNLIIIFFIFYSHLHL